MASHNLHAVVDRRMSECTTGGSVETDRYNVLRHLRIVEGRAHHGNGVPWVLSLRT